jgi:hypothetical protein
MKAFFPKTVGLISMLTNPYNFLNFDSEIVGAMISLPPHLDDGYAELLDDFGNVAAEWHDKKYAAAILNGECTVQRWHQMFHDIAVEEGSLVPIGHRWIAARWLKVVH